MHTRNAAPNTVPLLLGFALVLAGCVTPHRTPGTADATFLRDRLVVNSEVTLSPGDPAVQSLVSMRAEMSSLLALRPSDEPIYVNLFESVERFSAAVQRQSPSLQDRRAVFVSDSEGLTVYARWTERIDEDLRHEVAHGYLHSVAPQIPLWLDEGIAEYFEVPPRSMGLNAPHLELLHQAATERWVPNLPRLEILSAAADLQQRDYAEAWLWVHFCLNTTAERRNALLEYLERLQSGELPNPLSEQLAPQSPELLQHLAKLRALKPTPLSTYLLSGPHR